jgi:DnaJ-class molecular chaperone
MEDCNPDEMYSRVLLGVGLNASRKDIESAFRRKALHCHPDKLNLTKGSDEYLKATDVFLDLTNAKDYLLAMLVKPIGEVSEEQEQASQNHQNDKYQHKGVGIGERNGPYTNGEWRADKDFRWDEELGVFKSPNGKTFYCEKFDAENFMWKYSPEKDLFYKVVL